MEICLDLWHKSVSSNMKYLRPFSSVLSALFLSLTSIVAYPSETMSVASTEPVAQAEDSLVSVIAWFNKRDTMTYWINESKWAFDGQDTLKNMDVSTKVMINVLDSTKKGYRMEYRFMDFGMDTAAAGMTSGFIGDIMDTLRNKVVGTTVKFRTDEVGQITKIDNEGELRKQAKSVLADVIGAMPFVDSLAAVGIRTDKLLKGIDADMMVDSYIEELEMLFQCHGNQYAIGETSSHNEATDTEYASDTYMAVWSDPESYKYEIVVDINNYIPREDIRNMLGDLVDIFLEGDVADSVRLEMDSGFEGSVKEDAVYNSYLYISYFPDGWPEELVYQETVRIGDKGKADQKYIVWDYRSIGNFD